MFCFVWFCIHFCTKTRTFNCKYKYFISHQYLCLTNTNKYAYTYISICICCLHLLYRFLLNCWTHFDSLFGNSIFLILLFFFVLSFVIIFLVSFRAVWFILANCCAVGHVDSVICLNNFRLPYALALNIITRWIDSYLQLLFNFLIAINWYLAMSINMHINLFTYTSCNSKQ